MVLELEEICLTEKTTSVADVHSIAVRNIKETFLEEASSAVRDHAVTLHLSETKTTVTSSTLCGLPSQNLSRSSSTRVDLVTYHVLQTLIISWIEEDHDFEALASEAIIHNLVTVALIAQAMQLV